MTNTNIQAPVPIQGRGMIIRPNGGFQPGEFRRLVNCELIDQKIISRRPLHKTYMGTTSAGSIKYKGVLGNTLVYLDEQAGNQYAVTPKLDGLAANASPYSDIVSMFTMAQINKLTAAQGSIPSLCAVFNYNNRNYWLLNQSLYDTSTLSSATSQAAVASNSFYVISASEETGTAVDGSVLVGDGELAAKSPIIKFNYASAVDPGKVLFRNAFIFKDRLWVTLDSGIYFSKATDPSKFAVPDGGFFNFPDDEINYAVAVRDSIFVFCDTKVYVITYSTDPNVDATVRVITSQLGGDHAVVYQDTVYFLNHLGIFVIVNNSYVDKIINADELGLTGTGHTLESFGNYLVLNKGVQNIVDLSPYTTRYNKFRNGYITSTTTLANVATANSGATLSRDDAAGAVTGLGLTSTSAIKALSGGTTNSISWISTPGASGARHILVNTGDVLLVSLWVKNNCPDAGYYAITVRTFDSAGTQLDSTSVLAANADTTGAWQQIKSTHTIGNSTAAGTPEYAQINVEYHNNTGNFLATEAFWATLIAVEPYKSSTPYLFASNNDANAKLYNVNSNALGTQKVYFNPLVGAGTKGTFPNIYDASQDAVGLGIQTVFINLDTKAIHGITPVNQSSGTQYVRNMDMRTIQYTSNAYSGPLLVFSGIDLGIGPNVWCPTFMLMDKNLDSRLHGYKDSVVNGPGFAAQDIGYRPWVGIEIDSFVPDGLEYLMKKFRSVMISGRLPSNVNVAFAVDDQNYGANINIADTRLDSAGPPVIVVRAPFAKRVGLNIRGHALSMFFTVPSLILNGTTPWEFDFEITDLRVLWGYTSRGPDVKAVS